MFQRRNMTSLSGHENRASYFHPRFTRQQLSQREDADAKRNHVVRFATIIHTFGVKVKSGTSQVLRSTMS